jgi:chromosome segregation ATPase
MKKLTFFNALLNYNKANTEIENLTASNSILLKKTAELEYQKTKVEKDLAYMTSEMKKYKSLNNSLKEQAEKLAKTIEEISKKVEELSKTDTQPDININVTTSDAVTDTIKTDNTQPKPKKNYYKKKK